MSAKKTVLPEAMVSSDAIRQRASEALRKGEFNLAERLLASGDVELAQLIENLRIYQAELEIQNGELREAQVLSQQHLERFSSLFAHMPLAELVVDRTGLIHDANSEAARLFALNDQHLRQHYLRRLIEPSYERELAKAMVMAHETGASQVSPVQFRAADGHGFSGELHVARLPGPEGEPGQFVCGIIDLSEYLRQEAELRATQDDLRTSQEHYRILADYSPDWEYWLGDDHHYRYVSPACEAICGYPPEAFMVDAQLFCQLIHPDDRDAWHKHLAQSSEFEHAAHDNLLLRLIDASGSIRWIEHQCTPVHDDQGNYHGRRGVNRDVSKRVQAEAETRRVGRLLRTLSDVNQSITHINNEITLVEMVCKVAVETGGLKASLVSITGELADDLITYGYAGPTGRLPADWTPTLQADGLRLPNGSQQRFAEAAACSEAASEPLSHAWCDWLSELGIAASIHFPLRRGKETIGAISFFAEELVFLRPDVCALLDELAGDLAYALDSFHHRRLEFEARWKLAERQAHLDTVLRTVPLGIGIVVARIFSEVNAGACAMLGYSAEELIGQSVRMIYPDDAEYDRVGREKYAEIEASGQGRVETRWRRKDGRIIDVHLISTAFDPNDLSKGSVFTAEDISERRLYETSLEQASAQLEMAIEAADLGVYDFDLVNGSVRINQRYAGMLGYTPEELAMDHGRWLGMIHPDDRGKVGQAFMFNPEGLLAGAEVEYRMRHKSGAWVWLLDRAKAFSATPGGPITRAIGAHIDLTARKNAEAQLDYLSNYDTLTHLPNRDLLRDRLQHGLQRVGRENKQLAVLMLDLDRFKNVNETLGHSLGDSLLQTIAARIQAQMRGGDTLSRVGGDEFILLLENDASAHAASLVARKLLELCAQPVTLGDSELCVTASIGISLFPADGNNPDDLLRHADAALYQAKAQGRNAYQFFEPAMTSDAFEHLLMENALRGAVSRNELRVHYQPQIDMLDGQLRGVEALVRWQHPELGLVAPGRFIPLAEEAGLIGMIGEWVLREACRQIAAWDRLGLHVPRVAVNLSVQQIERDTLIPLVSAVLAETGLDSVRLELEVTESMIMRQTEWAHAVLHGLRDLGVQLAIDDFGTGYSSLGYLNRLPVHRLKIDQSFVRDIGRENHGEDIVRAIIALGRSLGMETVAEGVELEAQAEFLRSEACDIAQGYLYSHPVDADSLYARWSKPAENRSAT